MDDKNSMNYYTCPDRKKGLEKEEKYMYSILQEAQTIVNGDRNTDYGDIKKSFETTAKFASLLTGKELTAQDCCKVMMSIKLTRESYKHKRDNLVDLAGYAEILNRLEDFK